MADDEATSVVEMTPINIDQNKESLEKKFLTRRSKSDLVGRGILPSVSTPAVYAKETRKLEFAKTGDILKNKLQFRPDRQYLEQHNILAASSHVDPSLQGRQKKLKLSLLQESISEHLLTRPGPLELVQGNILPADEGLIAALSGGQLQFRTSADAFGDAADLSPDNTRSPPSVGDDTAVAGIPPAPDIAPLLLQQRPKTSLSPVLATAAQPPEGAKGTTLERKQRKSSGKKTPKMLANQTMGRRVFKFHHYDKHLGKDKDKDVSKQASLKAASKDSEDGDCSVSKQHLDNIMQQQLLLLQYQEQQMQLAITAQSSATNAASTAPTSLMPAPTSFKSTLNKGPVAASNTVAAANKPAGDSGLATTNFSRLFSTSTQATYNFAGTQKMPPPSVAMKASTSTMSFGDKRITRLEDMTTKQLRAELRARNMSGAGTKPQLVERLRSLEEVILQAQADRESTIDTSDCNTMLPDDITLDDDLGSETPMLLDHQISRPASRAPMDMDVDGSRSVVNFTVNPMPSSSFAMGVNPLVWQQPTSMMTMPLQAMFASPHGTPMLLPGMSEHQQFSWLPMSLQQQVLQQQMLACSQSVQQANAQIQQHQATLLALQQQHKLITSHLQQNAVTGKESGSNVSNQTPLSASWSAGGQTGTTSVKRLSSEEMLLLQQQQQIQQLYTALQQSQLRLAEAEQQAEQQAKYYLSLQQQYMAVMTTGQQHTASVSPQLSSAVMLPASVTVPVSNDNKMSASVPSLPVVAGSGYSKVSRAVTDPLLCGLVTSPPTDGDCSKNDDNQFADVNGISKQPTSDTITDDLVDLLFEHRGAAGTFTQAFTSHQQQNNSGITSHSASDAYTANDHFSSSSMVNFGDDPFGSKSSEAAIFDLSTLLSPAQLDMENNVDLSLPLVGSKQTGANDSPPVDVGNFAQSYNIPFMEWTADSVFSSNEPMTPLRTDADLMVGDILHSSNTMGGKSSNSSRSPLQNGVGHSTSSSVGYSTGSSNGFAADFDWSDVMTGSTSAPMRTKCHQDVLDFCDADADLSGSLMIGFDTGLDRLPVVTTSNGYL